jgi:hypothetical protein
MLRSGSFSGASSGGGGMGVSELMGWQLKVEAE